MMDGEEELRRKVEELRREVNELKQLVTMLFEIILEGEPEDLGSEDVLGNMDAMNILNLYITMLSGNGRHINN